MIYFDGQIGISRIGIWKVEETELFFSSQLSNVTDLEHVVSLVNAKRRLEWLAVRVLLKSMLGTEKHIVYTEQGKPYLEDNSCYMSISHTGKYVCVGLNPDYPIGLDAEIFTDRLAKMRERIIGQYEVINETDSVRHLTLHWCAKEAMFKLTNTKGLWFKDHLRVVPFKIETEGTFDIEQNYGRESFRAVASYKLFDEFALVCARLQ